MPTGVYVRTVELRKIMSEAQKRVGNRPPLVLGRHHSEETKRKIALNNKGLFKKGQIPWNKGKKGFLGHWKGKKMSVESCEKMRKADRTLTSGKNHYNWKGGITLEYRKMRNSIEYKLWRDAVLIRDNYTCIWCGQKGSRLVADHIKPFAFFSELRFALDNGRTLCEKCHKQTETFGGKIRKTKYYPRDILISKSIYGLPEKEAVLRVLDSGWLGIGKESATFEHSMAEYVGVKHAMFVNSGSSALLLGLKALNLSPSAEVITCAAGFPSTLSPILHCGFTPILVDCELDTYNIDPKEVEKAITPKTEAIVFAHAAGNPCDMEALTPILSKYPSVEDACDSIGASYRGKMLGSFGTVSAFSFFASHHITAAGGGGMALTNDERIMTNMFSLRDWGKKYIKPGYYQRNFSAYDTDVDGIPYDISYSYDTIGYNMKLIEIGAAFINEQFKRLPLFIEKRNKNHAYFMNYFFKEKKYEKYFIPPRVYPDHIPSQFFFVFILRDGVSFTRKQLGMYLEEHGVHTRPFFAGNISRQPALKNLPFRKIGTLKNSNKLMEDALMIGVHPAISEEDLQYVTDTVDKFLEENG